ncbi:MAG: ABC transporter ATP-binding protein [Clostridia bacterium]|nr:ABC transporter ATP-binding protein [Clostridia bacterium]
MTTIIKASKLCKTYANDGVQNHVLSNVDLEINEGEFVCIMGSSGSGKSTLLYCLSGMTKSTSGDIMYGAKNIAKMSEKDLTNLRAGDFGFVFQQMNLVPNLTLLENVTVPGYLNKNKSKKEVDSRANELLKRVGVEGVKTHVPSKTSGGQQQRCSIARSLINEPKVLFADEPTGALNKSASVEVLDIFTNFNKEGQTILLVTHDLRTAIRASRILYIEDGSIKGELKMSPYKADETKARETQVNAWLESLNW